MNKIILLVLIISGFSLVALSQTSPLSKATQQEKNLQPYIVNKEQGKVALEKLKRLREKTGLKPNIIWIVVDDMGWGDPGCFGGGAVIGAATPVMDRLAKKGVKLTSTYSQPTCTPTRSAILTGRLPARTGLIRPILAGDKITKNPWADEVTVAEILSNNGYKTVLSGKWHVGESDGMKPHQIGFDEFYGYYRAQKEYTQTLDERRYPDLVLDKYKLDAYKSMGQSQELVHGFKGKEEKVIKEINSISDIAEADLDLKDFTVRKINEFAKNKQPFFLEHAFMKVHADNWPSEKFKGSSSSKYPYKDGIVEVDSIIGDIVKTLKDNGILENTFIFITSDNGPQMDGWPDAGYTPFRGAKSTAWEGGVRVPGIAYWEGMIAEGRENDGLFDLMDLFNTSLSIAGIKDKIPTDRFIDGIDQTSFLLADKGESNRDKVFIWSGYDFMAIRMFEYKLHVKMVLPQSVNMEIDYSTKQNIGIAPWLFNLYIDPKEAMPVGHRRNAWLASMQAEAFAHVGNFKEWGGFKKVGL